MKLCLTIIVSLPIHVLEHIPVCIHSHTWCGSASFWRSPLHEFSMLDLSAVRRSVSADIIMSLWYIVRLCQLSQLTTTHTHQVAVASQVYGNAAKTATNSTSHMSQSLTSTFSPVFHTIAGDNVTSLLAVVNCGPHSVSNTTIQGLCC